MTTLQFELDPTETLTLDFDRPVHELVLETAQSCPERSALIDQESAWTYAQLAARSGALAESLRAVGVRKGDVVCLYEARSAWLCCAILGILRSGAAWCVLDPSHPPEHLADLVRAAHPRAVVAGLKLPTALFDAVTKAGAAQVPLRASRPDGGSASLRAGDEVACGPDDLAYVVFTSGTSGQPKGVLGVHGPLPHFLQWHIRQNGLTPSDRFSLLSGLGHDPLVRDLFTPLMLGATLCIPAPDMAAAPSELHAWLLRHEITVLHMTPSLAQIIALSPARLPVRHAFFGGEPLRSVDVRRFLGVAPDARCVNYYGTTETPQAVAFHLVQDGDLLSAASLPVGRSVPGAQLLLINAHGELVTRPGETGEIHVRTPFLTLGYLGDQALTGERYIPNPFRDRADEVIYRTGDIGVLRDDGALVLKSRADQQVKIRGFRVEIAAVEAAIERHPAVSKAVVLAAGKAGETSLAAYVAAAGLSAAELREFLRRTVPDHMAPSRISIESGLPLSPNGKVDRRRLAARTAGIRREPARLDFATATERRLASILSELLECDVGPEDDFFALGGHSLLAARLATEIDETFGVRVPLGVVWTAPRLRDLARSIDDGGVALRELIAPIQPRGTKTPVFLLPGGGGLSVMAFREVSRQLGPDQPVFGLEANLDPDQARRRLEDIAADYINLIRAQQPEGPYQLIGFSMGGFVAYEVARQLLDAGERVGRVIIFDQENSAGQTAGARLRTLRHVIGAQSGKIGHAGPAKWRALRQAIGSLSWPAREKFARQLRDWRFSGAPRSIDAIRQSKVDEVRRYAGRPMRPIACAGAIILAEDSIYNGLPADADPRVAWRRAFDESITLTTPGDHHSVLDQHAAGFAATLQAALRGGVATADRPL